MTQTDKHETDNNYLRDGLGIQLVRIHDHNTQLIGVTHIKPSMKRNQGQMALIKSQIEMDIWTQLLIEMCSCILNRTRKLDITDIDG